MIRRLRALPSHPRIFIVIPPPVYPPIRHTRDHNVVNVILPRLLRDVAAVAETVLIDLHEAFSAIYDADTLMVQVMSCI